MRTHKDLTVWQKSMELVETVYRITNQLPKSELFGLISQMQRSAISIPSNIAEGAKREHKLERTRNTAYSYKKVVSKI